MNACPNDSVLLQFLDGELNAEDDARVMAHVEDCLVCQEHLERLTEGRPAPGDGPPIETVRTDAEKTMDLPGTEVADGRGSSKALNWPSSFLPSASNVGRIDNPSYLLRAHESTGDPGQPPSTDLGDPGSSGDEVRCAESARDSASAPESSQAGSTEEPDAGEEAPADDPDRTATASGADPDGWGQPLSRRCA